MKSFPIRFSAIMATVAGSMVGFLAGGFVGVAFYAGKDHAPNGDPVVVAIMVLCPLLFYLLTAPWKALRAGDHTALRKSLHIESAP
jgi:hypothetical protein